MATRFYGRYEHSLDAKGRIILPARFRGSFDTQLFVSQYNDRCLALWTPDEFELQAAAMAAAQDRSDEDRNKARVWSSGLAEIELDRQGRVAIPAYLRDFARLDGQVLITGAINRIEVWNPAEFALRVTPAEVAWTGTVPAPPPSAGPVPASVP